VLYVKGGISFHRPSACRGTQNEHERFDRSDPSHGRAVSPTVSINTCRHIGTRIGLSLPQRESALPSNVAPPARHTAAPGPGTVSWNATIEHGGSSRLSRHGASLVLLLCHQLKGSSVAELFEANI